MADERNNIVLRGSGNVLDVPVIEHCGERVITLAEVDRVHGRPDGTARKRFNDHKNKLVEGEDYWTISQPSEIRTLGLARQDGSTPASLTLLSESGYLMVVKAFTDDLAWQVQRNLVNGYFRAKKAPVIDPIQVLNDPAAMRGLLLTYTEKVLALEEKVKEQKADVDALERIAKSDGSFCLTDAAKALQQRPKDLIAYLQGHNWIYKRPGCPNWIGYQPRLKTRDLEHKVTTVLRADGTEKTVEQVRVTAQGLAKLAKLFPPILKLVS